MSRHLFFGANTQDGFCQCFDDILFLDEARKIVYLKGSSGSGKSTLMKKVARKFEETGSRVDYIHCSNNIMDLDGICVRDYGIAIIDATSPHVCDPHIPVAIDEIRDLAVFLNRDRAAEHAEELLELHNQKKPYYEKAYRYLNAACTVYANNKAVRSGALDDTELNRITVRELAALDLGLATKIGRNRRMFACAVSPQGLTNYLSTMVDGYGIIRIESEDGTGSEILLSELQRAFNKSGVDTETCYCPWDATKPEHLFIPALNMCYLTSHEYCRVPGNAVRAIDLNSLCDEGRLSKYGAELSYNAKLFDELLMKSMEMMASQKTVHDEIERIYISCMDFNGLNECTAELIERLTALPRE